MSLRALTNRRRGSASPVWVAVALVGPFMVEKKRVRLEQESREIAARLASARQAQKR
jgi:hypothetical protein